MFRDYIELRNLAPVADILAQMTDWPSLYDTERLANNEVPVYASIYVDDMYVSYDFARKRRRRSRIVKLSSRILCTMMRLGRRERARRFLSSFLR